MIRCTVRVPGYTGTYCFYVFTLLILLINDFNRVLACACAPLSRTTKVPVLADQRHVLHTHCNQCATRCSSGIMPLLLRASAQHTKTSTK